MATESGSRSSSDSNELPLYQRSVRRPIVRYQGDDKIAICPTCEADVDETLGAPTLSTCRLVGQRPLKVDGRSVNVRGYLCQHCNVVLAIAPSHVHVDLEDGWSVTVAFRSLRDEIAIVVPSSQLGDSR